MKERKPIVEMTVAELLAAAADPIGPDYEGYRHLVRQRLIVKTGA